MKGIPACIRLLFVFPGLLFLNVLITSQNASALEVLVLDPASGRHPVGLHMEILEDKDGKYRFGDISSGKFSGRFSPSRSVAPGFGYTNSVIWLRFTAVNSAGRDMEWYLEIDNPLLDRIDFYIPAGKGYVLKKSGDSFPFSVREIQYRTFVFPLTMSPGSRTFYVRIESTSNTSLPLIMWTPKAFFEAGSRDMPLQWMYFGLMLVMILYNLFIYFSIRENDYIYFVLFILSFMLFRLAYNGLAVQYVWPDLVWWANNCVPFLVSVSVLFLFQFSRKFLKTARSTPLLDKVLLVLMGVYFLSAIISMLGEYKLAIRLSLGISIFSVAALLSAGTITLMKGSRPAKFYLIAWTAFLVGSLLNILRDFGYLPVMFITTWGQQIGSALQVVLFSLGLADRIKSISAENVKLFHEMKVVNNDLQGEIAERRKVQDSLIESRARYLSMSDNIPGLVYQYVQHPDRTGEFTFVNEGGADILGLDAADLIRTEQTAFDIIHPDDWRSLMKSMLKSAKTVTPWRWEGRARVRGEYRHFQGASRPSRLGNGNIVWDGLIMDITDRRRSEEKIQQQFYEIQTQYEELEAMNEELERTHNELLDSNESLNAEKERLAVTLRSIGDGVITTDIRGKVMMINHVAEQLTGWPQHEAAGKPLGEVFHIINEKTRRRCENPFDKVMETGAIVGLANHTVLISKDGTERMIADSGAPIRDRESKIIGAVLVFRDITEKHMMEEELLKSRKIESLGVFAGGLAHDFNNILTAVIANISLVKLKLEGDDENTLLLQEAEKASLRARDLTQQLLTFSRGGSPVKKTASVVHLLNDTVNFILSGSGIKSEFHIPEGLWPVDIDEGQISQVINNLVINAKQAMNDGGTITVRAENLSLNEGDFGFDKKGKFIKISIEDQGEGIPEDHLQYVFDPYFTTKENGSGLGLTSSYSIIKKHDGFITVDSRAGDGSVFSVFLPVSGRNFSHDRGSTTGTFRGSGRILLMDDEVSVIKVAGKILNHFGYEVEFARDGREAIEIFKKAKESGNAFDAVLMDLTIPGGMGGKEAIGRLLEIDPGIRAIVSSGYSNDPIMADCRKYGFSGVITKPYRIEELGKTLSDVMKGEPGQGKIK